MDFDKCGSHLYRQLYEINFRPSDETQMQVDIFDPAAEPPLLQQQQLPPQQLQQQQHPLPQQQLPLSTTVQG
jgi:hypothetical protein